MKISTSKPDIDPDEWYNTTQAIEKLGMSRTTFWRKAKEGMFRRRLRTIDGQFYYRGKELLRVWHKLI